MLTFVINHDPQRWAAWTDRDVQRWAATVPPVDVTQHWRGPGDQQVKTAITRSLRTLMEHAAGLNERVRVLQDDAVWPLTSDGDGEIHLYEGWHRGGHVCPRAFSVTPTAARLLASVWSNETRPACWSWRSTLTPDRVTYGV